jgi:four helix bundle protein
MIFMMWNYNVKFLNRCIMGNFRKLLVWLKAKELAVRIYKLGKIQTLSKDYGLKDQIQRAAVSIPANIAEGDELGTDRQSIKYFFIAKGSAAELQTLLMIANEIGYIENELTQELFNECNVISIMLWKIIKARSGS